MPRLWNRNAGAARVSSVAVGPAQVVGENWLSTSNWFAVSEHGFASYVPSTLSPVRGSAFGSHAGALRGTRPTWNGLAVGSETQLPAASAMIGWMNPDWTPVTVNASLARSSNRCDEFTQACGGSTPSMHAPFWQT